MEEWRDVKGYEGLYQVSSEGRVKSLDRVTTHWRGGIRAIKGSVKKARIDSGGYLRLNISKEGEKKSSHIHVLVAMAFHNHIPDGHKIVIDHIDHNKLNNNVDNLQRITNRENISKDTWRKNPSSKFTGVHWSGKKQRWISRIGIDGKTHDIGEFKSELKAAAAYQKKLKAI